MPAKAVYWRSRHTPECSITGTRKPAWRSVEPKSATALTRSPAITVRAATVSLLKELLVLPLQLIVEDNPINTCATFLQALGFALIGAVDLRVVLDFARLLQLGIERLAVVPALIAIAAMRFEQV